MQNSLKLSFTNNRGLRWNFVDCESFPQSKDSSTHMHGLAVYVKEGLPFARNESLENSADSYLCFRLALLHSVSLSVLLLFPLSITFFVFVHGLLILFHLT